MDAEIDLPSLRRRNKQVFVERAFGVFGHPEYKTACQREKWVNLLIEGYCVHAFIQRLKEGQVAPETASGGEVASPDAIGRLRVIDDNLTLHAGLKRKLMIRLENHSERVLQTTPEEPLFVAYHWYRSDGQVYDFDGARTPLPRPLAQSERLEMPMKLTPPAEPGEYRLMVTMVHEGRCWMEEAGMDVYLLDCTVQDYDGRGLSRHALSVFKQLQAAEMEARV